MLGSVPALTYASENGVACTTVTVVGDGAGAAVTGVTVVGDGAGAAVTGVGLRTRACVFPLFAFLPFPLVFFAFFVFALFPFPFLEADANFDFLTFFAALPFFEAFEALKILADGAAVGIYIVGDAVVVGEAVGNPVGIVVG
jgi:hypothetical protein